MKNCAEKIQMIMIGDREEPDPSASGSRGAKESETARQHALATFPLLRLLAVASVVFLLTARRRWI